jgi:gluconate 2-dehydrogenase gamma chain
MVSMSATDGRAPVLHFLNPVEAAALDAMAARIVPGEAGNPGAHEAAVVVYIDRALAGFLRDQQTPYRVGIRLLDAYTAEHHGRRFAELGAAEQDEVLTELDRRAQSAEPDDLGHFFAVVREHVIQGLFCDPSYGGNRDGVGWRMVGFPGARWGYSPREMTRDFDATGIPLTTLADLYAGDRSMGE